MMQYGKVEGVDKPVSRIFLGSASIPENMDTNEWLTSVFNTGVNAIDTARVYPNSEQTIGRWFYQSGNRDKVVVLSKCCHPFLRIKRVNAKTIKKELEESLEALKTDYIDIYVTHRDDPKVNVGEIVEAFNELKALNKIRAFGCSNWTHERIEEANEYSYRNNLTPFAVSSPSFSLANQLGMVWDKTCVTISGCSRQNARDWYRKSQMPILAYSSLGRGLLSGRINSSMIENIDLYLDRFAQRGYAYPENYERLKRCELLAQKKGASVAQIALAWIFHQGMNMFAVVNTSKAERMRENIGAFNILLSDEECLFLDLEVDRLM